MLFGKILKQSAPFTFNLDILDTQEAGGVLAIHNIALGPENQSTTSLWVKKDGQEFLVATLSKEKLHASIEINLFIQEETQLIVKGPGSIHVVGSFEMGEDLIGGQDFSGDELAEDEQQQQEVSPKISAPKTQTLKHVSTADKKQGVTLGKVSPPVKSPVSSPKLNAAPVVKPPVVDFDNDDAEFDDLSDEENSLIDGDEDEDEDLDDIDIDDSIEDDDELPVKQTKVNHQQGKQAPQQNKNSFSPKNPQNKPFNKGQPQNKGGFQNNKPNQNKGKPFKKN